MPSNFSHHNIIRKTTIQVLDIFNEQQVRRYDKAGNVVNTIGRVPVRFGPKEKWYHEWSKHFDRVLPAISVYFNGIEFDTERNVGIHQQHIGSPNYSTGLYSKMDKPAPYDLLYTVTLWAKYNEDINQLLENILPYFQPYVFVSLDEPVTGDYLNIRVELESANNNTATEYSHEEWRFLSWDLSLRAKTWLFKAESTEDIIRRVYVHWWGYDATVAYSVDGTSYQMVQPSPKEGRFSADIARSITRGLDYDGGTLDWQYSIEEPPYVGYDPDSTRAWR